MANLGYAFLCVAVPISWGLLVVWAIGLVERRLGRSPGEPPDQSVAMDDQA